MLPSPSRREGRNGVISLSITLVLTPQFYREKTDSSRLLKAEDSGNGYDIPL
jgi:hypothetical protein